MSQRIIIAGYLFLWAVSAFASAFENNTKGMEAMNAGRFEEAVIFFSAAHREEPGNGTIKSNLAVAYNNAALEWEKKRNFDTACAYMKKALSLEPRAGQIRKNFANILTNEGIRRYKGNNRQYAAPLLKEALEYDDSLVETHSLLGQVYYDMDDYDGARRHWEKALALDPSRDVLRKQLDKLARETAREDRRQDAGRLHFKVRYEGADMWTASREVLDMLEDAWNNAGWKLGEFPREPLTVIIYTQQEFQTISGKSDWFAGAYDGKIRLRRIDVEGDRQRLRQIVYHEYMHAYVHYVAGPGVPIWLNEGIAQCYENMPDKPALSYYEKKILKDRIVYGMPGLDTVEQMFSSTGSRDDVSFAYAYAKGFVAYLIQQGFGINIKNILDELSRGTAPEETFQRIYCRSIGQMREDWLRELRSDTPF